jgi:hypothetical protein
MFIADDAAYYAAREEAARQMARDAKDTVAWLSHFTMAREYQRLAIEAKAVAAASLRRALIVNPEPVAMVASPLPPSPARLKRGRVEPLFGASVVTDASASRVAA